MSEQFEIGLCVADSTLEEVLRSGVSVLRSEGWTYDELAESGYTVHDQRDWIWTHQENGAGGLEEAISAIVEAGEGAIDLSQDINGTIRSSLISVGQTDEVLGEMCIFVSIRTDSGYLRKEHAARTNMLSVIKSLIRKLTPTILFAGASLHVPSSRVQNLNNGLQYISPVTYFSPKLLATHDRELLHQTPHANICDCGDGVLLVSDENFVYVHDDASEQEIEQHLGLPFFDEYRDGDRA